MKCPTPLTIRHDGINHSVPCGKCGACKKNRRADWSFRLKQELRNSENGYFITLTYRDIDLPDFEKIPTLKKKDLQNFIKRLREEIRKLTETKFRYYAVGEYGTQTERPHYHLCGFNIPRSLLRDMGKIWGMGGVDIHVIEDGSIHYVSKFHMNGNKEEFVDQETGELFYREAEFATMSRRPGIGANYIDTVKSWHIQNKNNYVINNGYRQRLPRYYKDKIFDFHSKKLLAAQSEITMQKETQKEFERLAKLGHKRPFREIWERALAEAKKIKEKRDKNGTF